MKYSGMEIKATWIKHYIAIVIPCILAFFIPKIILENVSINELHFLLKDVEATALASRWTLFLLSFCAFNMVGVYILFNTIALRSKYIERKRRLIVYGADLVIVLMYFVFSYADKWVGRSTFSGSDMLGVGTMSRALQGKGNFIGWDLMYTLNVMVELINISSVLYTVVTIEVARFV